MTILCWLEIPPGWRCEIKRSDGHVLAWTSDKPVAPTCRFRYYDPRLPRNPATDPWMTPGDYTGPTAREWFDALSAATHQNERAAKHPGGKRKA